MSDEPKILKIKHHVATSRFSYFEFETETDIKSAVAQAKWLSIQFPNQDK